MAKLVFTSALKRFFPELEETQVEGNSVKEVIENLQEKHPKIRHYLFEEDGSLRKHVNIFIKEDLIADRQQLSDTVQPKDEILVYQALSGG